MLLLLVRHVAAVEEKELGAEQADAFGAVLECVPGTSPGSSMLANRWTFDAVDRLPRGLRVLELGFLQLDLFLAQLVFVEDALIRIDDDDARMPSTITARRRGSAAAGVLQADHRRDPRLRATMAVCDVAPPTSVMNEAKRCP